MENSSLDNVLKFLKLGDKEIPKQKQSKTQKKQSSFANHI